MYDRCKECVHITCNNLNDIDDKLLKLKMKIGIKIVFSQYWYFNQY